MLRNNFNHVKRKTLRGSRWQTTQKRRLPFFFPVVFRKMEQIVTLRTGQLRKRLSILFYFTAILIQFSR